MKNIQIVFFFLMIVIYLSGCGQKEQEENAGDHEHSSSEELHDHSEEHNHDHSEEENHDHEEHKDHEDHEEEGVENSHDHSHEDDEHEHEELGHDEHEHEHDGNYHVEKVTSSTFHEVVKTSGRIKTLPANTSFAVAPSGGVVNFTDNSILPGRKVKGGEILALVSSESLAENNQYVKFEQAKAEYENAKGNYERAESLFEDKLISEKEFLNYKTEYQNAKSDFESRKEHFSDRKGSVLAPKNGYVSEILVNDGEHVEAGQKIASVINKDKLMLEADVSNAYADKLDDFVKAHFLTSSGEFFTTEKLNGKILTTGKSYTERSYYLPVHFQIDTHPKLVPGSYVSVFLIGRERQNVISLPKDAFIEEQGNFFVFTRDGDEFNKTPVKTGANDGKYVEVLEGVKPGDSVVTHGAYHIKLMQASEGLPEHSHNH